MGAEICGQPLWLGYIASLEPADYPLFTIPTLSKDFDTPMQKFKPFTALLNWRIHYRSEPSNERNHWHGEVLLMWSDKAAQP